MPSKKSGFHEPKSRSKPKGLDLPVPGHNDLRPGQRNESVHDGPGRSVLNFADGTRQIHDFGSPKGYPSQSPASARYTPGLRKNPTKGETDPAALTIQPGIPRVR